MLQVDPRYAAAFERLGLDSCAAVAQHFATVLPWPRGRVAVAPASLAPSGGEPVSVFYKLYEYARPAWRFWGRWSKARCEFRNYGIFESLGIPCATRVACGEERDGWGRLRRAFIITRAVPGAVTLAEFIQRHCPSRGDPASRRLRAGLAAQLAEMTRRIHDAGFFHRDLVSRNILVTWTPPETPRLWWIDCPRGRFVRRPLARRPHRLKDLVLLDKTGRELCARGERLAFLKEYLQRPRLDAGTRRFIGDLFAYWRRRWPEDWR